MPISLKDKFLGALESLKDSKDQRESTLLVWQRASTGKAYVETMAKFEDGRYGLNRYKFKDAEIPEVLETARTALIDLLFPQ